MRTPLRFIVLALTSALAALVLTTPASAAASPYCGITWGSLEKDSGAGAGGYVDDVRSGQHACYDRLVIDITGSTTYHNWQIGYVSQVVADASGEVVPLRGGAYLNIRLEAPTNTPNGTLTYAPANRNELVNVAGYRTFRQVALTGSFEGVTNVSVGVRARLPFRVFMLNGPRANETRIVVDVAHLW
jgi:hypothetical protein